MKRGGPLKRTELRRKSPMRAKRRPRPAPTPDMRDDLAFWSQRRHELWTRSQGRCEVGGEELAKTGMEAHHRWLRSQGGGHGLENLLALCPACHHDRVHAHPTWAKQHGYIVPRVAGHYDPAAYAVTLYDGRTVRLTEYGGYDTVFPAPPTTTTEETR